MIKVQVINITSGDEEIVLDFIQHEQLTDVMERYKSIYNTISARHYLIGEAVMRVLCLRETGIAFADQQFVIGAHGKPQLAGSSGWHFNKSHSLDCVVVATGANEMGVDIEKIRNARMNVASRYFTSLEQEWLNETKSPEILDQRFYQIWTAKEAYLKFLGTGISYGLQKFNVIKECAGYAIDDDNYSATQLILSPIHDLYQLAICTAPGVSVEIKNTNRQTFLSYFGK